MAELAQQRIRDVRRDPGLAGVRAACQARISPRSARCAWTGQMAGG
jgi:hypothetical protein